MTLSYQPSVVNRLTIEPSNVAAMKKRLLVLFCLGLAGRVGFGPGTGVLADDPCSRAACFDVDLHQCPFHVAIL